MNQINPDFLMKSRTAFVSEASITIADLKVRVERNELNVTARRDMLSALNRLDQMFGKPTGAMAATASKLRELFDIEPAKIRMSAKTFANIRANVARALRIHGDFVQPVTRRIPPSEQWQLLLDRIVVRSWRHALYRLACFCTAMVIDPDDVNGTTLLGFHEALDFEEVVKTPKFVLKNTISAWNRCRREVAGWPDIELSSPLKPQPWTLPLDAFPDSFRSDIASWVRTVTEIDPLAMDGPARALRPATIEHRIREFRMMGSALVHRKAFKVDQITGIDCLVSPANFKEALRFFLDRQNGKTTARIHNLASSMHWIARHHVKMDDAGLAELAAICTKLNPGTKYQMTDKNRERLRQFDDEATLVRFLNLPENLAKQARSLLASKPVKAARLMERAVLFAIQINYALRIRTLRCLSIERNFMWDRSARQKRCFLVLAREDLKGAKPLEFDLSGDQAALIDEHLKLFRPHLPNSDSEWLFPGERGRARSKNAVYEAITSCAGKHAGLILNPHLFRHALAKITVEHAPELEGSVRQVLGHTSMTTTYAHYLGTETKSAGKHLDKVLGRILNGEDAK